MNKTLKHLLILALCALAMASCGDPATPTVDTLPPATETALPQATAIVQAAATTAVATIVAPTITAAQPTTVPADLATATPDTSAQPTLAVEAAAIVNGQPLPMADYMVQIGLAESSFRKQMSQSAQVDDAEAALVQVRHQVLEWMIDQMLIDQAAKRLDITVSQADVDAEYARAKGDNPAQFAQWLQANSLTEETFRLKLESELLGSKMRDAVTDYLPEAMEQVRIRHILVGSREEAEDILSQIKSSDDFVRLAQTRSLDMGSRDNGGDLGYYPRGVLSPEIDGVAFNMVTGQISEALQTSFGYHIIQVLDRQAERPLAPEMLIALRQQAFMDWLVAERGRAEIEYLSE